MNLLKTVRSVPDLVFINILEATSMKHENWNVLMVSAVLFMALGVHAEDAPKSAPPMAKPRSQFVSPEVLPDKRVIFRVSAPDASKVELDATPPLKRTPMEKDGEGLWTVTVGPVSPGLYHYWIRVDGVAMADAMNPLTKPALFPTKSLLEVPGNTPEMTEFQDVPHGVVRLHTYRSKALGIERHVRVYTPPGYRDDGVPLPVLYLYPGSTNHEGTWMGEGRAHFIMDTLLAAKRCVPMLVVMPAIHALDPRVPADGKDDYALTDQELITDIVPMIDSAYRTLADRDHRALAGLSKGSFQVLRSGLTHPDLFSWIGAFSGSPSDAVKLFKNAVDNPEKFNAATHLLWLGVGREDFMLKGMQELHTMLDEKKVRHTWHLSDGIHEYTLWRPYLAEFASLLFKTEKP